MEGVPIWGNQAIRNLAATALAVMKVLCGQECMINVVGEGGSRGLFDPIGHHACISNMLSEHGVG